uniref:Uncharacterized protein n=1 Tax=Dulem virus 40 TaxID=3145758 RepID=A0AAU8AUV5_9CAUD
MPGVLKGCNCIVKCLIINVLNVWYVRNSL